MVKGNYLWIYLALIACLITSLSIINFKFITNLLDNKGELVINSLAIGIVISGIISLCYLLINFSNTKKIIILSYSNPKIYISIFLIGLLMLFSRMSMISSINYSPHPALSNIIINMNVIFTLILSFIILGLKINYKSIIGIFICLIGIIVVAFSSNN